MPTPEEIQDSIQLFTDDVDRFNEMLIGDDTEDVVMSDLTTRGSIAKQVKERVDYLSGTAIYESTAEGLASTSDGQYFSIPSATSTLYLELYKNNAEVADFVKAYPSKEAVDAVLAMIQNNSNVNGAALLDSGGFAWAMLSLLGEFKTPAYTLNENGFTKTGLGDFFANTTGIAFDAINAIRVNDNINGVWLADENGFVFFKAGANGVEYYNQSSGGGSGGTWSEAEIEAFNSAAVSYATSVRQQTNPKTPIPDTDWVVFVMYGQSLSTGWEGWPALSKTGKYGNKSYGASVRPNSRTSGSFTPMTSAALYDLVGTNQDVSTFAFLSDVAVAALTPGDGCHGETPLEGWINGAKRLYNLSGGDSSKVFIGINCGVGGQSIQELSKGDATNYYLRYYDALTDLKTLADAAGKTISVISVAYLQGEEDYNDDTSESTYQTKLVAMRDNMAADAQAIFGQTEQPLFMTYQTGASFSSDTNDLAIGNAQLNVSNEQTNWVLATTIYQMPDKGGHLDPNGYRWTGCQFAKVWERMVLKREGWKPVQPLTAQIRDNVILVNFQVPCPPLRWGMPYVGVNLIPTDYAAKGFYVLDESDTPISITAIELVADCVVQITLASVPTSAIRLFYASKTLTNGNGCLKDSDISIADDVYEYNAGTGQYAAANIAELIDEPYDLSNWCVAFVKTVEEVA